jgi:hypothetical protein
MTDRATTSMTSRDAADRAATVMTARSMTSISARAAMDRAATAMTTRAAATAMTAAAHPHPRFSILLLLTVNCWFWAHVIRMLGLRLFTVAGMRRGVVHA